MKTTRMLLLAVVSSAVWLAVSVPAALAQTPVDPSVDPVQNDSATAPITPFGIHVSFATLLLLLGLVMVLFLTIMYMRYAPRFSKDEESLKVVRADRVVVGQELPRRNVDLSQASPVIVAPPAVPGALDGAPAPVPAAMAAVATATAPEGSAVPQVTEAAPAAPAAAAPAAPAPAAAAPAPRVEVTMDQAVFDTTLQELLDAGTDRRIAEGKARRAGMIAAKKAAGDG
jgi:hypothetical protein